MALFNYRAVDADGHTVAGRIDAMNIVDLEMRLRRMDLDLVKGEPVSNKSLLGTHHPTPRTHSFLLSPGTLGAREGADT